MKWRNAAHKRRPLRPFPIGYGKLAKSESTFLGSTTRAQKSLTCCPGTGGLWGLWAAIILRVPPNSPTARLILTSEMLWLKKYLPLSCQKKHVQPYIPLVHTAKEWTMWGALLQSAPLSLSTRSSSNSHSLSDCGVSLTHAH